MKKDEDLCILDTGTIYSILDMPIPEKDRQRPFNEPDPRLCGLMHLKDLKNGKTDEFVQPEEVERAARELMQIDYLLVVKTLEWVEPGNPHDREPVGFRLPDPIPGVKFFDPGRYKGESHLFGLVDGSYLGGFRVTTANSEHVSSHGESQNALSKDLEGCVRAAVAYGATRFIPKVSGFGDPLPCAFRP
jgi:hypothetical protein